MRLTILAGPANPKCVAFEQTHESSSETQVMCRPDYELLQQSIQVSCGTQIGQDVQNLPQLIDPAGRRFVELGISKRNRANSSQGCEQVFLLAAERACSPR